MTEASDSWDHAWLCLQLLAVDPMGLGGITLRARASPMRDACLTGLPDTGLPVRRLHPNITDSELFDTMDVGATLAEGTPVLRRGLFSKPALFLLTMAERCPADLAAKLALALDAPGSASLIALDEGAEEDERVPPALSERLAFFVDLTGLRMPSHTRPGLRDAAALRRDLGQVTATPDDMRMLTHAAARLGVDSLRAPLLALRAAKAHACLSGRGSVAQEDLETGAALVLAHRATILPLPDEEPAETPPDEPPDEHPNPSPSTFDEDRLVDAVHVLLPDGLLPQATSRRAGAAGMGAGNKRNARQRGRPLASRPGRRDGRSRVDLIATLRAAAPWQTLRRTPGRKITVLPSDIHLKRFETRTERVLIFLVDASGSAAHARLNEAKGAVEHLLARAYASRDRVALIGFRNQEAEVLLPPNRSLLLAKRRLSALPGGGATPLAHGLQSGAEMAWRAQKQGLTPTLVLLTDGRANVALDGDQNRQRAMQDAEHMADFLRMAQVQALVLDTAIRPQKPLIKLAHRMGATHIALPRASSAGMSQAIETAVMA